VLDDNSDTLDSVVTQLPDAYARLVRLGSYGSFFNFYLCAVQVRSPSGRQAAVSPSIDSNSGTARCEKVMIRSASATRCGSGWSAPRCLVVLTVLSVTWATCRWSARARSYTAQFVEAGGLAAGDDVTSAGSRSARCGPSSWTSPSRRFVPGDQRAVRLADLTTAEIRPPRCWAPQLRLTSRGQVSSPPPRHPGVPHLPPYRSRTSRHAHRKCTTGTGQLATSLDTLAETLHTVAPDLPAALDGSPGCPAR